MLANPKNAVVVRQDLVDPLNSPHGVYIVLARAFSRRQFEIVDNWGSCGQLETSRLCVTRGSEIGHGSCLGGLEGRNALRLSQAEDRSGIETGGTPGVLPKYTRNRGLEAAHQHSARVTFRA